jgi:predicted transporter
VGTYWATIAPVLAEIVGIRQLNAGLSISFFLLTLPLTFSEAIGLEMTQHAGSYLGTQLFTGFMYITGALVLWHLKVWKIRDLEKAGPEKLTMRSDVLEAVDEETGISQQRSRYLKNMVALKRV